MQIEQPEIDPEIPEAKYGRRMARQAARQWDRMFGNIPIGMFVKVFTKIAFTRPKRYNFSQSWC